MGCFTYMTATLCVVQRADVQIAPHWLLMAPYMLTLESFLLVYFCWLSLSPNFKHYYSNTVSSIQM